VITVKDLKKVYNIKDSKLETKIQTKESNLKGVGYMRIMTYYKPVYLILVTIMMAGIYSLAFPVLGLISAKY